VRADVVDVHPVAGVGVDAGLAAQRARPVVLRDVPLDVAEHLELPVGGHHRRVEGGRARGLGPPRHARGHALGGDQGGEAGEEIPEVDVVTGGVAEPVVAGLVQRQA